MSLTGSVLSRPGHLSRTANTSTGETLQRVDPALKGRYVTIMIDIGSPQWVRQTEELDSQRLQQIGWRFDTWELRSVAGQGGSLDIAIDALGFDEKDFGLKEVQAVSCRTCGGLFLDHLWTMRRHRLDCGWR